VGDFLCKLMLFIFTHAVAISYNLGAHMISNKIPKSEDKSMRFKKVFTFSFVLSAVLGIAFAFTGSKNGVTSAKAISPSRSSDFPGETLVDEHLSVSIMAASTTGYSTAYDVKFSTGGDAFYDTTNMVNVLGNDDSLMDFYNNEFKNLSAEEKTQWRADVAAGIKSTLYYEGYIHSFQMNNSEVYAPRTLSRGVYNYDAVFTVNITSIASNALPQNARAVNLYIPKEITSIPSDAFTLAPDLEHIFCEHLTAPVGFEDGWNAGAEVSWGQNIYDGQASKYENVSSIATKEVGDPAINYILGYYPKGEDQLPLTIEYNLVNGSETVGPFFLEFEKVTKIKDYDSVGKGIAGYSTRLTFVIEHEKGYNVDVESVIIHNIYAAQSEMVEGKQEWYPIFTERYYSHTHKMFDEEYNLDEFIKIKFSGITTFNKYTSINTKLDVVNASAIYRKLKPKFYQEHEKAIKNGTAKIRFRFTGLTNAKYHVFYGDNDKHISIESPIPQYILKGYSNNNFTLTLDNSLIYEGFKAQNIKAFSLNNVSISIDIVKNDVILTKTVATTSFGAIYLLRDQTNVKNFSLDLFFSIFAGAYLVAAFLVSAGLFLYSKRKYRNDEFRRLKPKQFIKKAVIYSLTSLAFALAILFVVMRLTVFNNAIVVYNPLDIFIVIFGIAAIIILGYYIKNLVVYIKANKQRKRIIKLGLQNQVADDGTK